AKNQNSARGLMQITNQTRKILDDSGGEIKDHYVTAARKDLNDPSVNICAGVRWLFHERELASGDLGRQATWLEAISKYKGLAKVTKKRAGELMDRLKRRYKALQKCGKK